MQWTVWTTKRNSKQISHMRTLENVQIYIFQIWHWELWIVFSLKRVSCRIRPTLKPSYKYACLFWNKWLCSVQVRLLPKANAGLHINLAITWQRKNKMRWTVLKEITFTWPTFRDDKLISWKLATTHDTK